MKRIKLIAVILAAFTITVSGATYQLVSAAYPINVNGQKLAVEPLNLNGTTYLPLRAISEAVGVSIEWNSAKKSVEINTVDVEKLKAACTMIIASDGEAYEQGSGVYVEWDEVWTSYHAVDEGRTQVRTAIDKNDPNTMTVIASAPAIDAAILKPTIEKKPVKIGDSDEVKVGDQVIVIGAPDEKEDTVIYTTVKRLTDDIVINKTINGGGSGSALFDFRGNLIGIVVASSVSGNESYAIPINTIRKAL